MECSFAKLRRKIWIVLISLIIWEIIGIALLPPESFHPTSLRKYFVYAPYNAVVWFLRAYLFFMLISPLIQYCRSYLLGLSLLILAIVELRISLPVITLIPLSHLVLPSFGFFLLGFYFKRFTLEDIRSFFADNHLTIIVLYSCLYLILVLFGRGTNSYYINFPIIAIFSSVFIVSISYFINVKITLLSRAILAVKDCSYLLFVIHTPIVLILLKFVNSELLNQYAFLFIVLWPTVSLIASLLLLKILNKFPPSLSLYIAYVKNKS